MTFSILWTNRERPRTFSKRFLKVWAKRLYNFPALMGICVRRYRFAAKGVQIGDFSIVYGLDLNGKGTNLSIGAHTFISNKVHMATHEKINIGNHVVINEGVKLLTASHDLQDPMWRVFKEPIVIGNYAWIATDAIILPGVTVGEGAVVGAGAVVSKDVPPYGIATGNPARISKKRRRVGLRYDPVTFAAPYEAWFGKNVRLTSNDE